MTDGRTSTTTRLPDGKLFTVKTIERRYDGNVAQYNAATRVYVDAHDVIDVEWPVMQGDWTNADDVKAFEKATAKSNREYVKAIKPYAHFGVELLSITEVARAASADVHLGWSRKAGCSCGCSPAFVTKDGDNFGMSLYNNETRRVDVFITVKAAK